MKNLILIIIVFITGRCYSQVVFPVDTKTGKVTYSEDVKIDNTSASELFNRAKNWFSETYATGKDVIQSQDEKLFNITGNGTFKVNYVYFGNTREWGHIDFPIMISCKDGSFKYVITKLHHNDDIVGNPTVGEISNKMELTGDTFNKKQMVEDLKPQIQTNIDNLIKSLKSSMSKPLPVKSNK